MLFPKELNQLVQAIIRAAGQTYATVSEPIQWATIKLMEFGPEIANYNSHFRRVLGAIADYSYQTLIDVGVDVKRSQAGFYLFPNFELCREKLAAKGVKTGQDMCDLLFEEKRIAAERQPVDRRTLGWITNCRQTLSRLPFPQC